MKEGKTHFRIVAKHSPSKSGCALPNAEERRKIFMISKKNKAPTHLDLAIGSRVSCTANLGTQIGNHDGGYFVLKYNILNTIHALIN